jgi:hypothetical protein
VIVGDVGDLSVIAYEGTAIVSEHPSFELLDRERNLSHRVRIVPTPPIATELLEAHSEPTT